ncbi:uncharacterized protein BDR25DRAFT_333128 [Lindgomyces ingoldianus]|uniref:Uncharacterized protein n=1 Tax=Lindgomyces ingoldianus TaxID=673940 RepID=A0ACB6R0P7_9PLEO|nr:uncharacterized protein BDR25DRAFT_333128 [Lindgomyces ingoldianus]KAF2472848.1 hypothetical protein BDR25DRAFT_333128 [Lindgomyces ingoldianus]
MEREYEFFVTTDESHQPDGASRGLIRRLVMRHFFEAKSSTPANNSSEYNSASTVQAKTQLQSRFRLSKAGQTPTGSGSNAKGKNSEHKKNKVVGENKDKRLKSTRKLSGTPDMTEASDQSVRSRTGSRKASPKENGRGEVSKEKPRLLLKANPNSNRFDPFDVLPVPGTAHLDMLFKLYKSGSRANAIAINARNTWWPFISNDAGLLHATLATWAVYGILVRGMSDLAVDKLRHKNEAIKHINSKIDCPRGRMSDELVGTVLTLASFENLLGAYEAAQLHIQALKRIVNARGGLFAFGHNDGLVRGIIWVDFHSATAFHHAPSFPLIRLHPDTPALPDGLLEEAAFTSPTSLLQLSVASIDCFNIFYRLHRLALAATDHWLPKVHRITLSNLLYETEYTILSVPDYSRDFLDFDLEPEVEVMEDYEKRAATANGASVVEAVLATVQIFIYASLREIPPKAKIFSILLERVRVAIDRPNISMLEVWRKEKNLNILVWVVVVATTLAPTWGGRRWWIGRVGEVVEELGIHGEQELQRSVQRVAWTDIFFGNVLRSIWEEVTEYLGDVGRVNTNLARDREPSEFASLQPTLPEGTPSSLPVEYVRGRWKVDGWYI